MSLFDDNTLNKIAGKSINNFLLGGSRQDVLKVESGSDSLYGGSDNEELIVGSGNDPLGGGK